MAGSRSSAGAMAILTWLAAVSVASTVVMTSPSSGDVSLQVHELGLIFAGYALACRAIACSLHDWGTLILGAIGVAFGVWFPYLNEHGGPRFVEAAEMLGWFSPELLERMQFPLVIAAAGATTAAGSYLVTHSGRVFFEIAVLSVVSGATLLLPVEQTIVAKVVTIAWHAGVAGSFAMWSVKAAARASGVGCPFCGSDLLGLTTPICPSCKHQLPTTCKLPSRWRRAA